MASRLDSCKGIDCVSIEDSVDPQGLHNPDELFSAFQNKTVILGVLNKGKSRVESVEEIHDRITHVLGLVPRSRLIVAPDCGLAMLPHDIAKKKLNNMTLAVQRINSKYD